MGQILLPVLSIGKCQFNSGGFPFKNKMKCLEKQNAFFSILSPSLKCYWMILCLVEKSDENIANVRDLISFIYFHKIPKRGKLNEIIYFYNHRNT